jgi:hypothetical protein
VTRSVLFTSTVLVAGWACASCAGEAPAPKAKEGDSRDAFVRVSPRDPRYFDLSDGAPYVPIGLNMAGPPAGGLPGMEAWIEKLARNRGNFARVWMSNPYFEVEHERSGQFDADKAGRIDKLLQIARRHNVRLKLCLEHFRHTGEGGQPWAAKPMHLKTHGGPARSTADFFDNPACRELYKKKLQWFARRYGDNPTVFAWELWNEMNCIAGGDPMAWTEAMLPELHRLFPRNLAVQSLGSFDGPWGPPAYRRLCGLAGNDVLQVHRYLDLGAKLDVCRGPVDLLAADAVGQLLDAKVEKPVLLAESGGVEPRHSGPLKLYAKDKAGIILHDVLFAPFFAGAAGPGHCWHWEVYVDRNDLWWQFGRFAAAVEGIDPPAERFRPVRLDGPRLRVYALLGRTTLLAWCRDSRNTWQTELADGRPPEPVRGESLAIDWPGGAGANVSARIYDPWTDRRSAARLEGRRLVLPEFSRSIVVKLRRTEPASR